MGYCIGVRLLEALHRSQNRLPPRPSGTTLRGVPMVAALSPNFGQLAPFSWTLLVFGRAPACWRDLGCYATARVVDH